MGESLLLADEVSNQRAMILRRVCGCSLNCTEDDLVV